MTSSISENKNEPRTNADRYPAKFLVRPRSDFRLLGTGMSLSENRTYEAIDAINQPNWESRGLVFVLNAEGDTSGIGFLLDKHDYVLVHDDEVIA